MHTEIRRLADDDGHHVAALDSMARAFAAEMRGGPALMHTHPAVAHWSTRINDELAPVWVATIDDVVVGFLALAIDGDLARVQQVFVEPAARELSLGEWLLDAALAHATAAGCTAIEALALPGDRETKNLYERAGITARLLVLRRSLT